MQSTTPAVSEPTRPEVGSRAEMNWAEFFQPPADVRSSCFGSILSAAASAGSCFCRSGILELVRPMLTLPETA